MLVRYVRATAIGVAFACAAGLTAAQQTQLRSPSTDEHFYFADPAESFIVERCVWTWYLQLNTGWATHHQNYGQVSSPSLWRLMNKLADSPGQTRGDGWHSAPCELDCTRIVSQILRLSSRQEPGPFHPQTQRRDY